MHAGDHGCIIAAKARARAVACALMLMRGGGGGGGCGGEAAAPRALVFGAPRVEVQSLLWRLPLLLLRQLFAVGLQKVHLVYVLIYLQYQLLQLLALPSQYPVSFRL